jgi:ethylbenzene dehydrogenase
MIKEARSAVRVPRLSSRRTPSGALILFATIWLVAAAGCAPAGPPQSPAEVQVVRNASIPAGPDDAAWQSAPVHVEPLILQDLVEPRLLTPSTSQVRVQAVTDGTRIAFRLEWDDPEKDDLPGAARFSDACAVQLPAKIEADVPAPQMGEANRGVEITYWRASWQAEADGRPDDIKALYPGATVDHYPFEAAPLEKAGAARDQMKARYSPARALGNGMEGPREKPVQDLIAEGPGTITPAPASHSEGKGAYGKKGWAVVLSRPLPAGLAPGGRSQVAFAVWQGSKQEVGSRKMRSGWTPLSLEGVK